MDRKEIIEALARGYCKKQNSNKELDSDLIVAMADEITPLFEAIETEALDLLRSINLKGPDGDGIYWLHVYCGRFQADINLGTNRDRILIKAFLDFEKRRKGVLGGEVVELDSFVIKKTRCPNCRGYGYIETKNNGRHRCPLCDGTGIIPQKE